MPKFFKTSNIPWPNLKKFALDLIDSTKNDEELRCNPERTSRRLRVNEFFKKYHTELFSFLLIAIVVLSQLSFTTSSGSSGNVEQWINLTNQMFYGKQDFLFSYGPLFWLSGGSGSTSLYNAYAYWISIAYTSVVTAVFWSTSFTLSYKARAYIYFAIAYFLFFNTLILPAALFLWPFAIVTYLEFSKAKPLILKARVFFLLGLLVGLSFYIRFFYGTVALATFGSYFLSRFLVDRKIHLPIIFIIGAFAGYVVIGLLIFNDPASVVDYLIVNSQLSFGNSVDMTLDVDNYTRSFLAVALIAICLNIFLLLRKKYLWLTVNVLLLLFFKLGFSRTDHYLVYFVIPVAALALVMLFDKSSIGRLLFILIMGSLYYLSTVPVFAGAPTRDSLNPKIDFNISYDRRMQGAYTEFKLDPSVIDRIGMSTIDIYPYNNEYMFANNLNYLHRPLFQNYMTLTPILDLMNQRFFESSNRPKFLLWTAGISCINTGCNPFEGFDQKFSLNEDPFTTSTILLNYHVIETLKGRNGIPVILLEKNIGITEYSKSIISTQSMQFGEWYKVPKTESNVTKLIPEFKVTVLGRLKTLLFRGNILKIKYKLVSGEIKEYRINILNSGSGIWVSPLLDSFEMSGLAVDSIMLETRPSNYFETTFKTKWVSIPISMISSSKPFFDPVLQTLPWSTKESQVHCDGFMDSFNGISQLPLKIEATGSLRIRGWLAISAKDGIPAEKTYLTLTNTQGNTTYILMRVINRPDVAAVFKQPTLSAAGYEALIDLSGLNGNYKLGLAGIQKAGAFSCSNYAIPLNVALEG